MNVAGMGGTYGTYVAVECFDIQDYDDGTDHDTDDDADGETDDNTNDDTDDGGRGNLEGIKAQGSRLKDQGSRLEDQGQGARTLSTHD